MVIVILAINLSGCADATTGTTKDTSISEPSASSIISNIQESVTIKVFYEIPLSLTNKDTILLEGLLDGEEYIEVIVNGEIYDFEQIALTWDESKNELMEKETVKSIEKLTNQTLVIKTYQPEGIPTEKIKWKSRTGKSFEYIIQESSLGDTQHFSYLSLSPLI
jgi:hypothetical protein